MVTPRNKTLLIAAGIAIALVVAVVGVVLLRGGDRTITSEDGRVTLTLPSDVDGDVEVQVTPKPVKRKSVNAMPGIRALGDPVDIHPVKGALPPGKVTVSIAYSKLPKGVSPANLGMAVYDTRLHTWVPILSAKADGQKITAVAPHFSLFSAIFVDPAKKVLGAAGQIVRDATTTVAQWFTNLFKSEVGVIWRELTGTPSEDDAIKCDTPSQAYTVKVAAYKDRVTACMDGGGDEDVLRVLNWDGFPILSKPLPQGVSVRFEGVFEAGDDMATLTRSVFWALGGRSALKAAGRTSLSVKHGMKPPTTVDYNLDGAAVAFDFALALFTSLAPGGTLAKAPFNQALKAFFSSGGKIAGNTAELEVLLNAKSVLDCSVSQNNNEPTNPFSPEGIQWAAKTVHDCASALLEKLNLAGALTELLDTVKLLPEVFQAGVAGLAKLSGNDSATHYMVTVSPFDAKEAFSKFVGRWYVHGTTLDIRSDYTGLEATNFGPCNNGHMCTEYLGVKFTVSQSGVMTGTYTTLKIVDDAGRPPFDFGSEDETIGTSFTMRLIGPAFAWVDPIGRATEHLDGNRYRCGEGATHAQLGLCG